MKRTHYSQSQISVEEQISMLKSEGLGFDDEEKAMHLLRNISMFRMKSHLRPLKNGNGGGFKQGSTFEQAYSIYKFDAKLRKMIYSELEKIEVSIRTQLSLVMSKNAGTYWFVEPSNFRDKQRHSTLLGILSNELRRSDDDAIIDFHKKYDDDFPPSWMTMEVSSFGTLSMLYKQIKGGRSRREVAAFYGLADTVLESWLHSIVYVRNICAHHGRLWNRTLRIQPLTPRHTKHPFVASSADKSKVFYIICIILYLLKIINPNSTFASRLKGLFAASPFIETYLMGVPCGWKDENLFCEME